ncbi:somatostatin receptor type 2-like [Glandiceps talaboti]
MSPSEVASFNSTYSSVTESLNITIGIDDWFRSTVIPVTFGIICCVGVIGNSVVIFVLGRGAGTRPTIPSIFFLNLAIADILYQITLPFYAYQYARTEWAFGIVVCKIFIGFDGMSQFTGIFLLTAMSIDRYLAIVYPIRCKAYRTLCNARIINVCVWILSVLCSLPLWIYASVYSYDNVSTVCITDWPKNASNAGPVTFFIFAFVSGFVLPLMCILICYLKIFTLILIRRRFRLNHCQKIKSNTRRVASLVIIVVLVFVVCWFPFYILNFVSMTTPSVAKNYSFKIVRFVSICLIYVNSCLNPIIYSFMGADFLKSLKKSRRRRSIVVVGDRRSHSCNGSSFM